jgi:hypothetical protein
MRVRRLSCPSDTEVRKRGVSKMLLPCGKDRLDQGRAFRESSPARSGIDLSGGKAATGERPVEGIPNEDHSPRPERISDTLQVSLIITCNTSKSELAGASIRPFGMVGHARSNRPGHSLKFQGAVLTGACP